MFLSLGLAVSGCSSSDKSEVLEGETVEQARPVEELYNEAADALDAEEYRKASLLFQDVERQYPYSKWATKAQLMSAFAAYKSDSYDEAVFAIDRFIELHPGNEDIDYAYYLKSLAYYEQISDVARDQEMTEKALESFDALITRFPNSQYTRDSKLKRDLTLDHLAGKEMEIGRYYLNRNQINAAINRFRTVVQKYQTTTHTPEALHRLVEAYLTLGLRGEATRVAAVLGHNYPGSKWYEDSYKILDDKSRQELMEDRSFIDKTVDSLFKPD
jgi:outer membrane protein assembly factor BamD